MAKNFTDKLMLTKKQHQVLEFIKQYLKKHGYAPNYEEIAHGINTSSRGSASKHISALIDKGLLHKTANASRSLELVTEQDNLPTLPFIGKIAAGKPLPAIANSEQFDLNHYFNAKGKCFMLEVTGDSMKDCGIHEGDWVIIRSQNTAHNGQIVVALVDQEEATLKRFRQNPDATISLIPENRALTPMVFSAKRITVQGILIAHIRRY